LAGKYRHFVILTSLGSCRLDLNLMIQELKKKVRKEAFINRQKAFVADIGNSASLLSSVLAGYRGVPIAGYLPIKTEIDPLSAMEEASAHSLVGVPVIQGNSKPLKFSRWEPGCNLKKGPFDVQIPVNSYYFVPEVLIIPMVGFDRNGGRLGYGGGFYDRTLEYLRSRQATLAIGFAYSEQEFENLPLEPTDQKLDIIITEREIIEFKHSK
jgi:5-formyltetrahydrofolate cyclo-ligase